MSKKHLARLSICLAIVLSALAIQDVFGSSITEYNNMYLSPDFVIPDINYKNETLELKIEFIGFDQSLVNESHIYNLLYNDFRHSTEIPLSEFHFDFTFEYASEPERLALETYMLSIADSGVDTGYELNLSLLQSDLMSGERSEIFIPRDGYSIDALLVEDYLYSNLYDTPVTPGYTFFIMNYSNLDSLDHTTEHWYDVSGVELDSNESTTWWYSGYGNLTKRAAMGWGGKYRFCYLDVSARSWYLDYVSTAWTALGGGGGQLYYQHPDIENLTQTYDPTTPSGNAILNQYLAEWINSYLGNVYSGPVFSDVPTGQSISLQVLVLNNLTLNGYAKEDIEWCISEYRIYNQLALDFPWVNWEIEINWVELSDYPQFYNYIRDNVQEDVNGRYIETSSGLYQLLEDELGDHFDITGADVVLPCYFFLTDAISFRWYGVSFAGLGGMGWEILLGTQYSLFEDGIVGQYRRGYSNVMIHELGHSLGLPHPHSSTYGWGSSFVADVMSYFAYDDGFSTFYIDAIGRSHTDANYVEALDEYAEALQIYDDNGRPAELVDQLELINNTFTAIPTYYQQMDYNSSSTLAFLVREYIADLVFELTKVTFPLSQYGFMAIIVVFPLIYIGYKIKKKRK
jgi:hypothetical protein